MLSAPLLTAQFAAPALYYKMCPLHQSLIPAGFYKPCVHLPTPPASMSNSVKECDVSLFHSLSLLHTLFLFYFRRYSSLLQSGLLFDAYLGAASSAGYIKTSRSASRSAIIQCRVIAKVILGSIQVLEAIFAALNRVLVYSAFFQSALGNIAGARIVVDVNDFGGGAVELQDLSLIAPKNFSCLLGLEHAPLLSIQNCLIEVGGQGVCDVCHYIWKPRHPEFSGQRGFNRWVMC